MPVSSSRNGRLDILRCMAVLFVIGRHLGASILWQRVGWMGVDLFFVLSGFLISGLLFAEYKERGHIRIGRFYARRALKLYPAFYFMIAISVAVAIWNHWTFSARDLMSELLYVQNYAGQLWPHTWSLAVEEHFYLVVGLVLWWMARKGGKNPFQYTPSLFLGVALGCLCARLIMAANLGPDEVSNTLKFHEIVFQSHTRADSLFLGVLLGYYYHFEVWEDLLRKYRPWVFLASLLVLIPFFIRMESWFMVTFGLTLLYIGFGSLLVLALRASPWPFTRLGKVMASIGRYSYSIYLWHIPVRGFVWLFLVKFGISLRWWDLVYVVSSIPAGIAMSIAVEYPILRWRDRVIPSDQRAFIETGVGFRPQRTSPRFSLAQSPAEPMDNS